MRKILSLLITLFVSLSLSAQDTITLTVSGEGATKEEAKANALRSAIEQAFGVFVSANTQFLNDEIVKDEIATIASGNIKEYSELGCITMPDGSRMISLSATVSIGNLVSYAKSKGSSTEFAGALWGMNLKIKKLNKENEQKALSHLIERLEIIVNNCGLFDVSISVDGKPYNIMCKDKSSRSEKSCYGMYLTLSYKANENTKEVFNLLLSTLKSLALTEDEIKDYANSNEYISKLSIANSMVTISSSGGDYKTNRAECFYLRNDVSQFCKELTRIINKSIYSSMVLQIDGLNAQYQINTPYSDYYYNLNRSEYNHNEWCLIDNRDYETAFKETYHRSDLRSPVPNWRELWITDQEKIIVTYTKLPMVAFLDDVFENYTLTSVYQSVELNRLGINNLGIEGVNYSPIATDNKRYAFPVCVENIFNFTQTGKVIYQITFDFPFTAEELERTTNISIVPNPNLK